MRKDSRPLFFLSHSRQQTEDSLTHIIQNDPVLCPLFRLERRDGGKQSGAGVVKPL